MDAKEKKTKQLKPGHLGIAGLITVLMQYGAAMKGEDSLKEVTQAELGKMRAELRLDLEKGFVRKGELGRALGRIDAKLEQVSENQSKMGQKISRMEGYMRRRSLFGFNQR